MATYLAILIVAVIGALVFRRLGRRGAPQPRQPVTVPPVTLAVPTAPPDVLWSTKSKSGAFRITARRLGDAVMLLCAGDMRSGDADAALADAALRLSDQGHQKVALNLADVPSIDSSGFGEIVRTYTHFTRQGGQLILVGANRRISDLLATMRLAEVIPAVATEAEAAARMNVGREGSS